MKATKSQIVLCAALFATACAPVAAERAERRVLAMGTELTVQVQAPRREEALGASERAIEALQSAERRLSTWSPASETSRFNAAPAGRPVAISPLLERDLAAALRCAADTEGAFSPGLGRLVQAWGLRSGGRRPADAEIDSLIPALRLTNLVVEDGTATRLDERFLIEEGAFGKGVGLDDAVAALEASSASAAVLDLGGQVAVWGATSAAIEIADPGDRGRAVLELDVPRGSVATTGNSERGIVVDGERLGHVLDPSTGRPGRDFGSVTVWSEKAARADCLSTALYVMGPERALSWALDRPEVGVVVLEPGAGSVRARASANLRQRLRTVAEGIELEFPHAEKIP